MSSIGQLRSRGGVTTGVGPRGRFTPRRFWLVSVIVMLSMAAIPSARADEYGTGAGDYVGVRPDNHTHTWCWVNAWPEVEFWGAVHGIHNLDDQSAFTQVHAPTCESITDVRFTYFSDSGQQILGDNICLGRNSANECESSRTRLNGSKITFDYDARKTACHEVGHSAGLRHHVRDTQPRSCMTSGAQDADWYWNYYYQHHVDHLNNCGCVG
ncbi:hypothetical protein [Blastococcus aurantiacus]|uniref:hypothetical protein n=1 Tax=Blastococcus aurantiacus TaxID=1550231 RepID=UPI00115FF7A3|nr:hypothetical protein [Blastococcus aurantiacus]